MKTRAASRMAVLLTLATVAGSLTVTGAAAEPLRDVAQQIECGIIEPIERIWRAMSGGIELTLTPPEGTVFTPQELERAKTIVEKRLTALDVLDAEVDCDGRHIMLHLPKNAEPIGLSLEGLVAELCHPARLTFRELAQTDAAGAPAGTTLEKIVLEGRDIESASAGRQTGQFGNTETVVQLKLKPEGAKKFEEATDRLVSQQISIWMDENMISAPVVNAKITGGEAVISGGFTIESASALASKINAGMMPFALVAGTPLPPQQQQQQQPPVALKRPGAILPWLVEALFVQFGNI